MFVGELRDKEGIKENVFKRNVTTLPNIQASCFRIEGEKLTRLMECISSIAVNVVTPLSLGKYFIDDNSTAYIDGDKLFQRHAAIVGSTGSGKSYCVAKLIEQMAELKSVNAVLFDIHGEYSDDSFKRDGITQLKIAAPNDLETANKLEKGILMIPYWLLNYEEMQALLLDRSDTNAPNQAMQLSKQIMAAKEQTVKDTEYESKITLDSPVAYDLNMVLQHLHDLDSEMVPGARGDKAGPFNGKLTRFNQRLENKMSDKRVGFMFSLTDEEKKSDWLQSFCKQLMGTSQVCSGGIKVIDFSEVPSDILPLIIGLIARIIFSVQQWSAKENRHPIALLCDEAHLYVEQNENTDAVSAIGLKSFERIAKEGRKYGVSLVIISQRPCEVNKTVLSQCNNFISLRLTNIEDQNTIKRLLPDNLGNIADNLALLDVGEAIVVGDATLLPSRIKVEEPKIKPHSNTIQFWQVWSKDISSQDLDTAVVNIIKQSKS
ncbi:ATP-binding protein [Merdimonas faecis]|uniref:ATP-binding protein n=1 Tax=Merdimonas faecis TaxID=1653435 RepID=UPI0023F9D40E|nr:ATP-binding protein [Merdimonas faecis]